LVEADEMIRPSLKKIFFSTFPLLICRVPFFLLC